jgi:hypothetical protein
MNERKTKREIEREIKCRDRARERKKQRVKKNHARKINNTKENENNKTRRFGMMMNEYLLNERKKHKKTKIT